MRWFWIDRFIEFERGRRAVAVKNISLVEEQVDGYVPGTATMPPSLIIEGLAQTGGLLLSELSAFSERVVLAKISKAVFHSFPTAGDTLRYTTEIQDIREDGAICSGTSHLGDTLQAEMDLVFAFLDDRFGNGMFDDCDLLRWLRLLHLYEVGRDADGALLACPAHLLEAEQQEAADGLSQTTPGTTRLSS